MSSPFHPLPAGLGPGGPVMPARAYERRRPDGVTVAAVTAFVYAPLLLLGSLGAFGPQIGVVIGLALGGLLVRGGRQALRGQNRTVLLATAYGVGVLILAGVILPLALGQYWLIPPTVVALAAPAIIVLGLRRPDSRAYFQQ